MAEPVSSLSRTENVVNAMTVDVEDYFQVSAFEEYIPREDWSHKACRVERNMERILGLFSEHGVKGTFFVLGWIAERYPQIVSQLVDDGHELASHGWSHVRVSDQNRNDFREDVTRTKRLLGGSFRNSRCADTGLPAIPLAPTTCGRWMSCGRRGTSTVPVSTLFGTICTGCRKPRGSRSIRVIRNSWKCRSPQSKLWAETIPVGVVDFSGFSPTIFPDGL